MDLYKAKKRYITYCYMQYSIVAGRIILLLEVSTYAGSEKRREGKGRGMTWYLKGDGWGKEGN